MVLDVGRGGVPRFFVVWRSHLPARLVRRRARLVTIAPVPAKLITVSTAEHTSAEPSRPVRRTGSVGGVELAVHDLGGDGPAMVLAHATGFHGRIWTPLAAHLGGWHLLAPDFRLHGDTMYPEHLVLDWWDVGRDVLATVDLLGQPDARGTQPVGVGHSMGGAALVLAELLRPGTFRALWLYEPIIFPAGPRPPEHENPMVLAARKRRPWFNDRDEAYENYASKPPLDELSPACLRSYVEHGFADTEDDTVTLKCLPEREAQNYGMGGAQGAFERLGELSLPVVVAHGRSRQPGPAMIAPMVAGQITDSRVRSYDDLEHFGPLAAPERVAADIQSDLESIGA